MATLQTGGYSGGNALLDRLHEPELAALLPHLTVYEEDETTVVRVREQTIDHVLFPVDAIYSVIAELSTDAYEVDVIGRDGVVGAEIVVGATVAPRTILCQGSGRVAKLQVEPFRSALAENGTLLASVRDSLRRQWFVAQQTVACNFAHTIEQRAARWILMSQDAVGRERFALRAEFFSMMLGISENRLREPTAALHEISSIDYDGERVNVRSRQELLEQACECYRVQLMSPFIVPPAS
jgi:hypothetical protein